MTACRPLLWMLLCAVLWSCGTEPPPTDYVARVGDQYLTQQELSQTLSALDLGGDSSVAREQLIEQWVTRALLYEEALRRDMASDPTVRRQLREQERAVLVNALTVRLYDETDRVALSDAELQAYYEAHREQLRLREPYVHVLFLRTARRPAAERIQRRLRSVRPDDPVAVGWDSLAAVYAADPSEARTLADQYHPESQLFGALPPLRAQLRRLQPGETAPLFEIEGQYHILHLIDRAEAGTVPERAWVEPEIRRRLQLRARKQKYAREVERLRSQAQARGTLELR